MDNCNNAAKFVKAKIILYAIRWTRGAWKDISQNTIIKYFRHAGSLSEPATITQDCGGHLTKRRNKLSF